MKKVFIKEYFGCKVVVIHNGSDWHPYPWTFRIVDPDGEVHQYGGLPNQCETYRSALKRAWWRAKWMADGTYSERYK